MTKLQELITISFEPQSESAFTLFKLPDAVRYSIAPPFYTSDQAQLWAAPTEQCGDTPQKTHPKFVMAVLGSLAAAQENQVCENLADWRMPMISFRTEEWTRRSMTLNGMRMCTEYFHSGSQRVFQLVAQRIGACQSDVVHDVLVYLSAQVLDAQAAAREARCLQAESLAAYLGLEEAKTRKLLLAPHLAARLLSEKIESGYAGTKRRQIDCGPLIENQIERLLPELEKFKRREEQVLQVVDQIVAQLYDASRGS